MNAPVMLQASQPSRIDRLLARSKAGIAAVREETDKINAAWRELPEEEKERQRMYWDGGLLSRKKSDAQWDADVDREERGLTPIQYYWENK